MTRVLTASSTGWPGRVRAAVAVAGLVLIGACTPGVGGLDCSEDTDRFDDHTRACLESTEDFFELAKGRAGEASAVKVTAYSFSDPGARHLRFMDGNFYDLHDELYMFNMLNGVRFEGEDEVDPYPGEFDSIDEIYTWAHEQAELPPWLAFWNERLYADRFYQLWRAEPRIVGPAVLIHYDAREDPIPRDEIWAFELEFGDDIEHEQLVVYFELLAAHADPAIADDVVWLVRSQHQEALAQTMEAEQLAYHDRILRYADLSTPGEVAVYNPGLTAGRLRMVRTGETLSNSTPDDILVFEQTPDVLPPCRALITGTPQTPLAHINILAKSRGIPNLSVAGITDDPNVDQIARVSGKVALLADTPDEFRFVEISNDDFEQWLALQVEPEKSVPSVNLTKVAHALSLDGQGFADAVQLRPIIGGKAAGMLALQDTAGVELPRHPAAISVRAYREHIASLEPFLAAILATPEFAQTDAKLRYLVLEGEAAYDALYPTPIAQQLEQEILDRPAGDPLRDAVASGGVREMIRERPIAPQTLADIEAFLKVQFIDHSPGQGLRFRSSSTVEDIEGFNGAGLYSSKTGFLWPELQPPEDQDRTVETALRKVWASYWSPEAFEERKLENVDHLSGAMAVLVHARFDDPLETANGVVRITRMPPWSSVAYEAEIDSQHDEISVTNPDGGTIPEVVRLRLDAGDDLPTIERLQASSLHGGDQVLDDAELLALFEQTHDVLDLWFETEQATLPPAQARQSLSLDLEYRRMADGWPMLADGSTVPSRVVLKQSRSLDADPSQLPDEVKALSFPRDLLATARRVEQWSCSGDAVTIVVQELVSDPYSTPDFGFTDTPFTGSVRIEIEADLPTLGLSAGEVIQLDHLGIASSQHPPDGGWGLELTTNATGAAAGIDALTLVQGDRWELEAGGSVAEGSLSSCEYALLHSTPDELLLVLLGVGG